MGDKNIVVNSYKSKGSQRDTIINLIIEKLNAIEFKINGITNADAAIEIEKECFSAVINKCKNSEEIYIRNWNNPIFVNMYSTRCGTVTSNINKDSYMVKKLLSGEWKLSDIGIKNADELDPDSSVKIKEYLEIRSRQGIREKSSNMYSCPKCKNKNHTQPAGRQFRSADEGQSFSVTCLASGCGFKWRVS